MDAYNHILAEHDPRGQLYIPVGIPGCGKSTYANQLRWATRGALVIASTDDLRQKFAGDVNDQSRNNDVFHRFHEGIFYDLGRGETVFADATNLSREARFELQTIAAYHNADTHLLWFKNLSEAVSRNARRERVVPSDVMNDMLSKYERALLEIPQEQYTTVMEIRSIR